MYTAMVLVIMLVIGVAVMSFLPALNERNRILEFTRDGYVLRNAVDGAKIYAEAALVYSYEQGCYDVMRQGGYAAIPGNQQYATDTGTVALWYDSGGVGPSPSAALANLEAATATNLNLYTIAPYTFLKTYEVAFPPYTVTLTPLADRMRLQASSGELIAGVRETETEKLAIQENPSMEREDEACIEIFTLHRELGTFLGEAFHAAIIAELDHWPPQGEAEIQGTDLSSLDSTAMGNAAMQEKKETDLAGAQEAIRLALEEAVTSLPLAAADGFAAELGGHTIEVAVTPSCDALLTAASGPIQANCTFTYAATIAATVIVTGDQAFLVQAGNDVVLSPVALRFAVRDTFDTAITAGDLFDPGQLDQIGPLLEEGG
ncbi:MAG: hypothetical protein HY369_04530 [Candidatus Aenigmarchaeota archaeon]|nr:hypothetical protein [Candidatus Aenigmarchaeota archaeon]